MPTRSPFPSLVEIAAALWAIHLEFTNTVDVRLQCLGDGRWQVHYGDPGYDQDHHGFWGAAEVPGKDEPWSRAECDRVAYWLKSEVLDMAAQSEGGE